ARAVQGVDAVVHLAGRNEVAAAADPDDAITEAATSAQRVAEAVAAAGCARVVFVSTVHVYGVRLAPGATVDEDVAPEPRHPYAIARLTAEHVLARAAATGDFALTTFRLTNAVGAPADPSVERWTLVANDLCRQAVTT